ncbi:hypothetical protein ACMAY6_04370 [Luminiphilus sp. nBUS_16]|uniref:hypothetical protein n=1 Tax=Luminiphilus sp. nBUS_16 TaxID=3395315 RepID=UPI003EB926C5
MSACLVTGCARGGKTVLSSRVTDALSQGDACDRLRQSEPLALLVLRCEQHSPLIEPGRQHELETLQSFIEAPWMLLQTALGLASHAGLKVVLELPQPTDALTKSVAAFWSCWLESRDFPTGTSACEVELRSLSEPPAGVT